MAINNALERVSMLSFIDEHWTEHLRGLDEVKEGIGLRAFGQRDPLVEYKMEAFKLFKEMMETINHDVVSFVYRAGPLVNDRRASQASSNKRIDRPQTPRPQSEPALPMLLPHPSYGVGSGNQQSSRDKDPSAGGQQTVVINERTKRNDPCPCGSGKKYKHCHGRA